jgi:hypothetical protein
LILRRTFPLRHSTPQVRYFDGHRAILTMSTASTIAASLTLKDLITFGLATVGAVLGVLNTWRAITRDQPKIKVIPKRAIPVGGFDERVDFCIEAVNLGTFALTITELGVLHNGTSGRSTIVQPILLDKGPWPRRLEPRSSVTGYFSSELIDVSKHSVRCAYAKTDCGLTFQGTTPALRQIAEALAAKQRPT